MDCLTKKILLLNAVEVTINVVEILYLCHETPFRVVLLGIQRKSHKI